MHRVFVYGTLRKGGGNHERLLKGAQFVGDAKTKENYIMLASGIPFVSEEAGPSQIVGEVYDVTDEELVRLDQLESYYPEDLEKSWYKRQVITVILDKDQSETQAGIYFNDAGYGKMIMNGDFKNPKYDEGLISSRRKARPIMESMPHFTTPLEDL